MVGNEIGNEGWFLSLEGGVCDKNSSDLDANTILLNRLGWNKSIGERMHALGGTGVEVYCGMWWVNGTELGNGNGYFC